MDFFNFQRFFGNESKTIGNFLNLIDYLLLYFQRFPEGYFEGILCVYFYFRG